MALQMTKTGLLINSNINEIHIEPDGSKWEHIFHHNNPALTTNLFASTDNFINGVYKNDNAWFNFQICNKIESNWEILVIQKTELRTKPIKLRWIQTQSPLGTTFSMVAPAEIQKNSSVGYTSFDHGGLVRGNVSAKTFLTVNNGTSGNWWGATGCFTAYQGGIPGFNQTIVKSGCIDIFIRIDSLINNTKFYKDGIQIVENIYEY